jgi:hypothetical protein
MRLTAIEVIHLRRIPQRADREAGLGASSGIFRSSPADAVCGCSFFLLQDRTFGKKVCLQKPLEAVAAPPPKPFGSLSTNSCTGLKWIEQHRGMLHQRNDRKMQTSVSSKDARAVRAGFRWTGFAPPLVVVAACDNTAGSSGSADIDTVDRTDPPGPRQYAFSR